MKCLGSVLMACVFLLFANYIPSYKNPRGTCQLSEAAEEPVWQTWLMLQPRVREGQAMGGQRSNTHYAENLGANKLGKALSHRGPHGPALMPAGCGVSARGPARAGTFDVGGGTPLCRGAGRAWCPSPSPGEPCSVWVWVGAWDK